MRRILLLVTVALVMAAMLAMSAAPAFAMKVEPRFVCTNPETQAQRTVPPQDIQLARAEGFTDCRPV